MDRVANICTLLFMFHVTMQTQSTELVVNSQAFWIGIVFIPSWVPSSSIETMPLLISLLPLRCLCVCINPEMQKIHTKRKRLQSSDEIPFCWKSKAAAVSHVNSLKLNLCFWSSNMEKITKEPLLYNCMYSERSRGFSHKENQSDLDMDTIGLQISLGGYLHCIFHVV